MVGQSLVTNDCMLCHQYNDTVVGRGTVSVNCALSLPAFRYVILQTPTGSGVIGLTEVQVFAGEFQFHSFDVISLCCYNEKLTVKTHPFILHTS